MSAEEVRQELVALGCISVEDIPRRKRKVCRRPSLIARRFKRFLCNILPVLVTASVSEHVQEVLELRQWREKAEERFDRLHDATMERRLNTADPAEHTKESTQKGIFTAALCGAHERKVWERAKRRGEEEEEQEDEEDEEDEVLAGEDFLNALD